MEAKHVKSESDESRDGDGITTLDDMYSKKSLKMVPFFDENKNSSEMLSSDERAKSQILEELTMPRSPNLLESDINLRATSPSARRTTSLLPLLTEQLGAIRSKTIMNTFVISAKKEYNKQSYHLYQETIDKRSNELYDSAVEAFDKGLYETTLTIVQKGLYMKPNNPMFYTLRGEAYLQLCDFQSAILNYKRVCIMKPGDEESFAKLAFLYFLQGQSYYDEQLYLDALENFTRAAEMKPEISGYHTRSIACLSSLKRHQECLKLINKRLEVESNNPDLFILRARLHILFCNSTLSYFDVKEALMLNPQCEQAVFMQNNLENAAERFKEQAIRLDLSGNTTEAITKMTHAINTNPAVTDYYILRAAMYRRSLNFDAAVDDLLIAMDMTDYDRTVEHYIRAQNQLLLTFNDFAVDCFRKGYFEESILLLEKAIQGEKNNASLYINRGDCFYKLGHLHFALLDYQQAEEMDSSDGSIVLRLSFIYNVMGLCEYNDRKYNRAEDYFSLAVSYDCENASLYFSRARARYMQEKLDEAKVDIISALYLDGNEKEFLSIFVRLFPGKNVDEVMSSDYGELVCEALLAVIHEEKKNLNKNGTTNSIAPLPGITKTRFSGDEKLQNCMKNEDFNITIINGKKKVNDLVESVIQSRQDLSFVGPVISSLNKSDVDKSKTNIGRKLKAANIET